MAPLLTSNTTALSTWWRSSGPPFPRSCPSRHGRAYMSASADPGQSTAFLNSLPHRRGGCSAESLMRGDGICQLCSDASCRTWKLRVSSQRARRHITVQPRKVAGRASGGVAIFDHLSSPSNDVKMHTREPSIVKRNALPYASLCEHQVLAM